MSERGERVLVVEDAESLRSAYRLVLESRGLDVREAPSAEEAVTEIGRAPPDAVIADLGLPDARGAEAARRIREAAPRVPLLVLTGRDEPELRSECERLEVADYRVKPFGGSDLADRVESLLRCSPG